MNVNIYVEKEVTNWKLSLTEEGKAETSASDLCFNAMSQKLLKFYRPGKIKTRRGSNWFT